MIRPTIILAKTRVPFYEFLNSYTWVADFIQCQNLKIEIEKLRSEETLIKGMPCDPKDVLENLSRSWQAFQDQQIEKLKTFIEHNWDNPDLYKQFVSECEAPYSSLKTTQAPDLKLFETALKLVSPRAETIKNKKREAALDKIAKNLADLKVKIATVSPSNFFMKAKAGIILDIRQAFVDFWEEIQGGVNAPCGPRGMSLKHSENAEQQAYKMLGIERYINADAQFSPNE